MQKGSNRLTFFLMMLSVNLLFTAISYNSGEHLLKDSHEYLWQAKNIASGNGWYAADMSKGYDPLYESYRPPGYGFFLFLLQLISSSMILVLLVQAIIAALSYFLIFDLINRFISSKYTVILLFSFLVFFPAQFVYNNMLMSEILFQLFICTSFYFLIRYLNEGKFIQIFLFYVALAFAVLTKPMLVLFVIPIIGLIGFKYYSKKPFVHYVPMLIPLLSILLVMYINYQRSDYFHYSSIKHKYEINYLAFLTLSSSQGSDVANDKINTVNKEAQSKNTFAEKINYISGQARQIVLDHPITFMKLNMIGYAKFFLEPGRWDIKAYFYQGGDKRTTGLMVYYILSGIISLVLLFATAAFMFLKSVPVSIRIAVALYLLYFLLIIGLNGTSRFRLPVYPIQLFAAIVLICTYLTPKSANPTVNE